MGSAPSDGRQSETIGARKAVLIGQLVVNLPLIAILLAAYLIGNALLGPRWLIAGVAGLALAWLWWSLSVPRWRRWALQRGAPPKELQKLAAGTLLVWPKGSVFEKTETKPKDRPPDGPRNGI